jgi:hypothetical protein
MMTAINGLQNERDLMRLSERKIRDSLADESPGAATSNILRDYASLSSDAGRVAFVTVLASRLAIRTIILSASI